jgi:hypothetical protein
MPYERKKVEIFTIEARNRILVTYFTFQYAIVAEMVNALVKVVMILVGRGTDATWIDL